MKFGDAAAELGGGIVRDTEYLWKDNSLLTKAGAAIAGLGADVNERLYNLLSVPADLSEKRAKIEKQFETSFTRKVKVRFTSDGRAIIGLESGVARHLWSDFLLLQDMTVNEFKNKSIVALVEEWKEHAFDQRQYSLSPWPTNGPVSGADLSSVTVTRDGPDHVKFIFNDALKKYEGQSPLLQFASLEADDVIRKFDAWYQEWVKRGSIIRKDPLE